jgi:hypothetical protein
MPRIKLMVFMALAAALALPGVAGAQVSQDVYKIDYFSNAHNSIGVDATVRIASPGATGPANLCAMIYVFDTSQELKECCGCEITPHGLLTLSVDNNLTNNSLTGGTLTNGVIEIYSTADPTTMPGITPYSSANCNPGDPSAVLTPALRAWATHIQNSGATTETPSQDAQPGDHVDVVIECAVIQGIAIRNLSLGGVGSGAGLCNCNSTTTGW